MIKNKCIECKCRDSTTIKKKQQPFEHLYCSECYNRKKWFSKFKEETNDWTTVMFDRSKKEDSRNGKLVSMIYE